MSNININETIYTLYNFSGSARGSVRMDGDTKQEAERNAEIAANDKGNTTSLTWTANSSSLLSGSKIGKDLYNKTVSTNKIYSGVDPETRRGYAEFSYSTNASGRLYLAHLKINISGLSANNIESATITIDRDTSGGRGISYYICAPKDNNSNIEDTKYYVYDANIFSTNRKLFTTTDFPIQVDITELIKLCINTGIGILVITPYSKVPDFTNYFLPIFSITYVSSLTACDPPTSISDNGTNYITQNGSIKLSWSGALAGSNNPIVGYRIYWKTGSVPYIGGAEGYYDYYGTGTSCEFNTATAGTFPSSRGSTYYFKICTRGSYAVNNAFLSPISDVYISIVYNLLPNAPNVSVDKSRIKSTGSTTINFTVTPGSDPDTSLTKTLYYATSSTGTKNVFTSPLSLSLNAATTYYFWTYDGYEFSENYTEKSIRLNAPPTITSVTMSAVLTFTPTTEDGYVKNINGSAQITKDPDATLTYSWKLYFNSRESDEISSNESFTNIDVTLYDITFNTTYKLLLTITDDLGESADPARSDLTFGIPAAPTITFYNLHNNSNVSGTTAGHFDTDVRFKYDVNNTGIDIIELWDGDTKIKLLSKNNNEAFIDTALDELTRGISYNLKFKFICNSTSTFSNISLVYRAADITPTNIVITRLKDNSIRPYTHDFFTIDFGGYVSSDVSGTLSNIYTIKLNSENMTYGQMSGSGSNISARVLLKDEKTTTEWKTLLGLNNAPNAIYTLPLIVTATNLFGKTFTSSFVNISLDFIENLTDVGSTKISIKNVNSNFSDIPSSYNSGTRYPLFETLIIKLTISGIQCYADQNADIEFYQGAIKLGTIKINSNNWISSATQLDPYNHFYTLNLGTDSLENIINYIEFQYTIPKITFDLNVDYLVKVILANNLNKPYGTNNLNICKYCKFNESDINFNITNIDKVDNEIDWKCNNLGSNNLSTKNCQFYTASILSNDFDDYDDNPFGSSFSINSSTGSTPGIIPAFDIVYFGAELTLTSDFLPLVDNITPFGEPEHIVKLTNLYTLYNQVPNLLYGKNFFLLNGTSIGSNSDGMLYLHTTGTRTKIYFGNNDIAKFEITQNGLIIDGGTWSS